MLNLVHQFLVLLEHEGSVPFYRFARWGSRKARGTIGKMLAMGLVESSVANDEKNYNLTQKGRNYLDEILSTLRQAPKKWGKRWHFLLTFQGENLWSQIRQTNLFLLRDGVWFSPKQIPQFTKKAITFEIKDSPATAGLDDIIKPDELVAADYHRWLKEAKTKLPKITKSRDRNFVIKKFILEYALIKKRDILPLDFLPENWPGFKAHKLYLELRRQL